MKYQLTDISSMRLYTYVVF